MPIYEYHCKKCDDDFELLLKSMNSRPICPECGGNSLEKKLSLFSSPKTISGKRLPEACGSCPEKAETCPMAHPGGCCADH